MEKVYFSGTRKEHEVLTYEEARERGILPVAWRDAREPGWVLTDDGYVLECIRVNRYKERREQCFRKVLLERGLVATVIGRRWCVKGSKLLWTEVRERRLKLVPSVPVHWVTTEGKKTRTRRMVKLYAMMLLAGRVDWHVLSVVWKPDQIVPGWRVRKLLNEQEIIEMVTKETYALMKQKGITPEYVIGKMLTAVEIAEVKKDAGAILRACEDFREMLGMERKLKAGEVPPGGEGMVGRDAEFEDVVEKAERELGSAPVQAALPPGGSV